MKKIKLEFNNKQGVSLSGLLELPDSGVEVLGYALFAHCFTCGKDIAAASRISRALAAKGIGVLRLDFTGLGGSDGDFSNSNFSSNVDDLVCAAKALEADYRAPELIIGHSLGGAAVLSASSQIPSIKAVVTIAAPATAGHLNHLFISDAEEIRKTGKAVVSLGGRDFSIKKQLIDDIDQYQSTEQIKNLGAALLIFHSPVDSVISIDEAAIIYQAAMHPKSFISLDHADHLLSRAEDAEFVASTIASWSRRYLNAETAKSKIEKVELAEGEVLITELDQKFLRGMYSNQHFLRADEPEKYGGTDKGPSPYDLLLMALGSCTSMTLRMYANRKKWDVGELTVRLRHERVHAKDCVDCSNKIDLISRDISVSGDLTAEQRKRLLEIADKCPVHRTMENDPKIVTELVE